MVNYNRVILAGNMTRDPELRFTNDGIPVCSFGIAVNRVRSRSEEVDFFNISAWREADADDGAASGGGGGQARRGGGRGGRREEVEIDESDFEDIPFATCNIQHLVVRDIL